MVICYKNVDHANILVCLRLYEPRKRAGNQRDTRSLIVLPESAFLKNIFLIKELLPYFSYKCLQAIHFLSRTFNAKS